MAISLYDEEKGILKYLPKDSEEAVTLKDITKYLTNMGYSNLGAREAENMVDHLIDAGYVRSRTEGRGDKREARFYLSKVPFVGGKAKQKKLQGRGIVHDTSRLIKRIFGGIFLLIGLGLALYEGSNLTGAVIGIHTSGFLIGALFVFVGLAFFFVKPKKK
jgi:hypothetical protein